MAWTALAWSHQCLTKHACMTNIFLFCIHGCGCAHSHRLHCAARRAFCSSRSSRAHSICHINQRKIAYSDITNRIFEKNPRHNFICFEWVHQKCMQRMRRKKEINLLFCYPYSKLHVDPELSLTVVQCRCPKWLHYWLMLIVPRMMTQKSGEIMVRSIKNPEPHSCSHDAASNLVNV
jgi:hypothetical protein